MRRQGSEVTCLRCNESVRPRANCRNSFKDIGVVRAHWDCWYDCNLECPFCFRSRGMPLEGLQALELVGGLAFGGVKRLAFTGGDPSLRKDLGTLLRHAAELGIQTEVLTNSQFQSAAVLETLSFADEIGLSLDGPTAEVHDGFRQKKGNFRKVLSLMDFLDASSSSYVVRTVVSQANRATVPKIWDVLGSRRMLKEWKLQQFSPIEQGFFTRVGTRLRTISTNESSAKRKRQFKNRNRLSSVRYQIWTV